MTRSRPSIIANSNFVAEPVMVRQDGRRVSGRESAHIVTDATTHRQRPTPPTNFSSRCESPVRASGRAAQIARRMVSCLPSRDRE